MPWASAGVDPMAKYEEGVLNLARRYACCIFRRCIEDVNPLDEEFGMTA